MTIQTAVRPDQTGIVPTANSRTIAKYTVAARSLRRQCVRDLGVEVSDLRPDQFIDWFVNQHGRWSENTIRVYRRGIETYVHAAGARDLLSPEEFYRLLTLVYPGPRARQSAQSGTASAKAYVVTETEARTVCEAAHLATDTDARIITLYCKFAPELGLRPCEWAAGTIQGDVFIAPNSKFSNKRANGKDRTILIDAMPVPDRNHLTELCTLLSAAIKSAGSWKKVHKRLASRLVCKANGLRRLCLYSFRGTACARYKDAGLSPAEIAALMGHAVDTTSFRSYPRARQVRGSWRQKINCRPHPRCVATVRNKYRDPALLRSRIESAKTLQKNDPNVTSNEIALIGHQPDLAKQVIANMSAHETDYGNSAEPPSLGGG
jgi:integrase